MFAARNNLTNEAYQVPTMECSPYDNIKSFANAFEIGLTIKDWNREK